MNKRFRMLVGSLCFAVLLPAAAYAQATIAGTVRDTSGAVLPGVTVEVASPALIEKTRSTVTDGAGFYRIEILRPGSYTVTATLPGFATVLREGIELSGSFVATVNVEMRLGSIEETITVSGEAPIIDIQSVNRQSVFGKDALESLPFNRMPQFLAAFTPGVTLSGNDVGGNLGTIVVGAGSAVTVHGSRSGDVQTMAKVLNMGQYEELEISTAAADATEPYGGVRMNMIPAEGGNTFNGSFVGSFANESMQSGNYTQALKDAGLATPNKIKRIWDFNPTIGGPIKQDKLWFLATFRHTGAWNYIGILNNVNAGLADRWDYVPGTESQASEVNSHSWVARVTWQATDRLKINIAEDYTKTCQCYFVTPTRTLEASPSTNYGPKHTPGVEFVMPVTSRLLLDGSVRYYRLYRDADQPASQSLIQVMEQSTGVTYRGIPSDAINITSQWIYRAALSYVAAGHSFKVGFNDVPAKVRSTTYVVGQPISYRFNNGVPNRFTQIAVPGVADADAPHDLGVFVQDRWTTGRLTLFGGLRFDYFHNTFPSMTLGPSLYTPNRNITTPKTEGLNWKDLNPRTGVAYDVLGDGKTAVKMSLNRYIASQGLRGIGIGPTDRLVSSVARSWTDSNNNKVVDCDLTSQAAQNLSAAGGDICGVGNALFGLNAPADTYDDGIFRGWGVREYNWEYSLGVQREILPRTSLDVSYFRRWYGNFTVADNRALAPGDFDNFTITVPVDPRLPGGGGYQVTGYDARIANVTDNYNTSADKYGKQTEHWNGVDVNFRVQPRPGMMFQGGTSTGRSSFNTCDIQKALPETSTNPIAYCDRIDPWRTEVKVLATYVVPRVDVQVGAAFQSLPGPSISANYVATNAQVSPSLGRNLSGGAANTTIAIIPPGSMYGDRKNQLDLRVQKVLRFNQRRVNLGVDIPNLFNANPITAYSPAYATWLRPQSILVARFVKFSAQLNF